MQDTALVVSAIDAAIASTNAIGGAPPPPPPPPVADLAWFTSKASGSITNIGSAVLQSLNPWPQGVSPGTGGFKAILAASGIAFCPWRGRAGSLIIFGGGHDDYWGNDVYEFDLYAQTYAQLRAPTWPLYADAGGYHSNSIDGEHWADSSCTTTRQDSPSSGHNYGMPLALPPSAAYPQGAVLMPCHPSLTRGGQRGGRRAHVFDLATHAWSRFSTNLLPDIAYGGSCIDATRNVAIVPAYSSLVPLDLATGAFGASIASYPSGLPYMMWAHYVAADVYVGLCNYGGASHLWVIDPVTKLLTKPMLDQAWPSGLYSGGACWSKLIGGFAYYHGQGEKTVITVKPPAGNVRTAPWKVGTMTFAGDAPPPDTMYGAGAHCKRFLEHEAAGGFLWLGQTGAPAQFWRA